MVATVWILILLLPQRANTRRPTDVIDLLLYLAMYPANLVLEIRPVRMLRVTIREALISAKWTGPVARRFPKTRQHIGRNV
jgi:hypothetical protein